MGSVSKRVVSISPTQTATLKLYPSTHWSRRPPDIAYSVGKIRTAASAADLNTRYSNKKIIKELAEKDCDSVIDLNAHSDNEIAIFKHLKGET